MARLILELKRHLTTDIRAGARDLFEAIFMAEVGLGLCGIPG